MSSILKGLNENYSRDEQDQQNAMDTRRSTDLSRERNAGLNEPDELPTTSVETRNGVYEYNVPAGQEDIAKDLGLQHHRGHWFSRIPIQRANFQFGSPQFHEIPAKGVAEASDDNIWGPQGRFAGDTHIDIGGIKLKPLAVGDIVKYFGEKAKILALAKDQGLARISIESGFGGSVRTVKISDLKQLGQGVAEAFGPLPRHNQQIRLGRHTVDIERVGLDKDYISFAWHDSQGQDHYEEVHVGDLGSYDDLIKRIKQEISYQERQYTDQSLAEGDDDFGKPASMMQPSAATAKTAQNIVQKQADQNVIGMAKIAGAVPAQGVAEGPKEQEYGPEWDEKIKRLGQMAKQGERKTVWDPIKRVYKTVPVQQSAIKEGLDELDENLNKWFKEKWVRFGPDGKIRGDCARGDDSEGKPKCLPQSKAQNLGKKGRASAAARKRREDPNPERSGKAINVATKKKSNEGVAEGSNDTVYPNATVIKSKNGRPVGEIYQDGNSWGCFHYRADRGYDFIDSREDAIQALKNLHQETGRSRPDYTIKGVAEEVNPEVTRDEYFEPSQNVRMGNFVFNARTFTGALGEPNAKGLQIRAYDPKNLKSSIGSADFIVKKDKKGNQWLESDDTDVDDEYRSKGVATMMYAFAKSLGNDIKPSPYQSNAGKNMWSKWGSDAKHLGEQGVAEQELDEACWKGYHKEGNKKMFGKTYPNCVKNTNEEQEQIDEKCWDTHKQVGMKNKGGKQVPNCVPKESIEESRESCPECGGPMFSDLLLAEKQDACYNKVKSRYKVWPSAYASGALVQCRKKGASNWGNGGKKNESVEENQLDEKWSNKYKDSINCSDPKGFSQKAHCAGKKKSESAIMKGLVDETLGTPYPGTYEQEMEPFKRKGEQQRVQKIAFEGKNKD